MRNPTPLSPAAQAVMDATSGTYGNYQFSARGQMIAAAYRAAAAHLPSSAMYPSSDWGRGWRTGINDARQGLLAIAAELDPQ